MSKKILLLTLQTFSTTGGIQKMARTLCHSLDSIADTNLWDFRMLSLYDANRDLMEQYLPASKFCAFHGKRLRFISSAIKKGIQSDLVILSHVHLSSIGLVIKLLNPRCKVWLIAHGIEIWRPLPLLQKKFLDRCDKVICVSRFTMQQVILLHHKKPTGCTVLNNTLDPFLELPTSFEKPEYLLNKYSIKKGAPIIFTLTRLAATEQYKGYEQVIYVVNKLKVNFPDIAYILAGQYDPEEKIRIQELISLNNVQENVILTGFIAENEIADYFLLADVFVLPSKKEGFGIVFIEALAYGLPVICGNSDGSIDAIRDGKLGKSIDVNNLLELEKAIGDTLQIPLTTKSRQKLQKLAISHFSQKEYIINLQKIIINNLID